MGQRRRRWKVGMASGADRCMGWSMPGHWHAVCDSNPPECRNSSIRCRGCTPFIRAASFRHAMAACFYPSLLAVSIGNASCCKRHQMCAELLPTCRESRQTSGIVGIAHEAMSGKTPHRLADMKDERMARMAPRQPVAALGCMTPTGNSPRGRPFLVFLVLSRRSAPPIRQHWLRALPSPLHCLDGRQRLGAAARDVRGLSDLHPIQASQRQPHRLRPATPPLPRSGKQFTRPWSQPGIPGLS
jgi:hypothetical protein